MILELKTEYTVKGFHETVMTSKLIAMGILPGSKLRIINKAPLGKVFFVLIDRTRFALRENELESIILINE